MSVYPPAVAEEPLADAEFDAAMRDLGPFEHHPHLAVAVSGGADSSCLALLARRWASDRGGRVLALVVDHGLRPNSASETRSTVERLGSMGIDAEILPWHGAKPESAIQERARAARYALLEEACARHGILHLLLGHHLDDQRETIAMRIERGSGSIGTAGMASVRELRHMRLLRPLLAVPKSRLRARLEAEGHSWIEDPTNADHRFARARLRGTPLASIPIEGGAKRIELERAIAGWAAKHAEFDPWGFIRLDRAALAGIDRELAEGLLASAIRSCSGAEHAPRRASLHRALRRIADGDTRFTLGGTILFARRHELLVVREPRSISHVPLPITEESSAWDTRFRLCGPSLRGMCVERATREDVIALRGLIPPRRSIPRVVLFGWPVLVFRSDGARLHGLLADGSNGVIVEIGPKRAFCDAIFAK